MEFIAEQCTWLRKNSRLNLYEYIAVYVDDLCLAAENAKKLISILKSNYHLKVKGDGPLTYHLGADYFNGPGRTMIVNPRNILTN